MLRYTLTPGDILYFGFYLVDRDPTTGEESYHDLSGANSLVFGLKKYGESTLTIEKTMEIVDPSNGYCRVLATVPPEGTYSSRIVEYTDSEKITWIGPIFITNEV